MLTVWSVCNGDKYTDADVYTLQGMVDRNIFQDYQFRCLSDREIPGIDCLIPEENWPGWWAKLLLFKYAEGQNLYFDLDVVITAPVDGLVSEQLSMPANWAQSGHGGCQSSVMSWGEKCEDLYCHFSPAEITRTKEPHNCGRYRGLWGDQEYITRIVGEPGQGNVVPCRGCIPTSTTVGKNCPPMRWW